jgi:hypothetical protein
VVVSARSVPLGEGRTRRHDRWARDAMDAWAAPDEAPAGADGKGVWSWSPDAGIEPADDEPQAAVATKPGTPGRARYKP